MKFHLFTLSIILCAQVVSAQTNAVFDRQHVDFRITYTPAATNPLAIKVRNADTQLFYDTNAVLFVVPTVAKYEGIPAGTPFGNAGDSLWILPQSQDPQLLYLGVSAAGINNGIFNGNILDLELLSLKAPGNFFGWQTDEIGGFNVKMNSRDGITANDKTTPIVGSHEHLNWGFSTNGVYCVTFRASGVRTGESTNTMSLPATFQFNVLPLRPFETWQSNHWAFATPDSVINPNADPDGDGISNVMEYAFGLNPTTASMEGRPRVVIINHEGGNYGALQFTRRKNASDLNYQILAADTVAGPWNPISHLVNVEDNGTTETVIIRDNIQVQTAAQRFIKLQVQLIGPSNYGCGCF